MFFIAQNLYCDYLQRSQRVLALLAEGQGVLALLGLGPTFRRTVVEEQTDHTGQNDTGLGLAEVLGHLPEEGFRQESGGNLLTLRKNFRNITI